MNMKLIAARFPSPVSTLVPLFAGMLALSAVGGCRPSTSNSSEHGPESIWPRTTFEGDGPIRAVCTTGQVADAVRAIGGSRIEATAMMGPGVDPHLYKSVPSDIERLEAADIVFYNGLHLEGRLADVLHRLAERRPAFAFTAQLEAEKSPLLKKPTPTSEYYDPHVWHDVKLWSQCVNYIVEVLSKFDPPHAPEYRERGEAYLAELVETDTYAREQIETISPEQRVLVTAHDAFAYFSSAYGLEPVGLKGVSTEDEVDIGRVDDVIDIVVKRKIPAVFVESSVAPRMIESLIEPCRKQGHEVRIGGELYSDALGGSGSDADTYVGMIRANVDTIVAGLKGSSSPSTTDR
ncbi:MAG: zinc ABC transporter substrate-binding protein [Pirellulales bacterium]